MVRAGVLALQGDFAAHARVLRGLGADVREVRRCAALDGLDALVIPGGESTALLRLMDDAPWLDAIRAFHARGGAILGTCAGAILLARRVVPDQPSLGLLDATIARNAWGRQAESFEADVDAGGERMPGVFIRAPRILETGPAVEVLARLDGEPVAVREGRVIAATFHPELAGSPALHRRLLAQAATPAIGVA
jgi:5'-phosphate synthase pdxT subunit